MHNRPLYRVTEGDRGRERPAGTVMPKRRSVFSRVCTVTGKETENRPLPPFVDIRGRGCYSLNRFY